MWHNYKKSTSISSTVHRYWVSQDSSCFYDSPVSVVNFTLPFHPRQPEFPYETVGIQSNGLQSKQPVLLHPAVLPRVVRQAATSHCVACSLPGYMVPMPSSTSIAKSLPKENKASSSGSPVTISQHKDNHLFHLN